MLLSEHFSKRFRVSIFYIKKKNLQSKLYRPSSYYNLKWMVNIQQKIKQLNPIFDSIIY